MIEIEVLLFAGAAQHAGTRSWRTQVADSTTVQQLRKALVEEFSSLQDLAQVSRWAIENEFVELDTVLEKDSQVAMIPPVSGG